VHKAILDMVPVSMLMTPSWHVGLGSRLTSYQPYGSDYYVIHSDFGLSPSPSPSTPTDFIVISDSESAVYVTGTVAFTATGATQEQVEKATKKSLATTFQVDETQVSVTASESRRLMENVRKLAGTWSVDYTITASKTRKASIESKVTDLKKDTSTLKTVMATELKAAGANEAVANSFALTSFAGKAEIAKVPPSTGSSTQPKTSTSTEPPKTSTSAGSEVTSEAYPVMLSGLSLASVLLLGSMV